MFWIKVHGRDRALRAKPAIDLHGWVLFTLAADVSGFQTAVVRGTDIIQQLRYLIGEQRRIGIVEVDSSS